MNKIYLVYGNEPYFIDRYIDELKDKYKSFDIVSYDMTESNISEALEDALMGSLFSSNKLILCTNCYFLTGIKCDIDHNIDDLLKYINMDTDNILILSVPEESLDKRKKIVKELEKNSTSKTFNKLKDYELNKFIKDYCNNNGYKIDNDALNLLIVKTGNDLCIITEELNKMFIYKGENKNIDICDIKSGICKVINCNIFDLIDAIINKNIDRAMELYDDLLLMNEEEIKLIVILANQFRLIYQVKEMYKSGYSENDIATTLDIHPYRIKLAKNINISTNDALKFLRQLSELDKKIKMGEIDKKIGFENFILNM